MISIGSLLGYIAGTVNLVKIFGNLLGDSQFKQLTAIAALTMNLTVLITSYAVEERVLITPMLFSLPSYTHEAYEAIARVTPN